MKSQCGRVERLLPDLGPSSRRLGAPVAHREKQRWLAQRGLLVAIKRASRMTACGSITRKSEWVRGGYIGAAQCFGACIPEGEPAY